MILSGHYTLYIASEKYRIPTDSTIYGIHRRNVYCILEQCCYNPEILFALTIAVNGHVYIKYTLGVYIPTDKISHLPLRVGIYTYKLINTNVYMNTIRSTILAVYNIHMYSYCNLGKTAKYTL